MVNERNYHITVNAERGVVEVAYSGRITLTDRANAVRDATAAVRQNGFERVLVDFSNARMDNHSPQQESVFADLLSRDETLAHCKTAFLSTPGQRINWFIELLARTRHFRCMHFHDRDDAYSWLAGTGDWQ